ncbi:MULTISPECIES: hypothetical protein [Enterobacteriaceae]|nr:hypothetical protein [Enterobacter hormaechei]ECP2575830.1 hypothetical protein [Salmonella enterica]EIQ4999558.1 hypothetical protein [Salmonella enterica]EIQ5162060.1 hypothetical protein [Salmonella enterica]EIS1671879.1 hypothetical protein [Salmonella enterica]EIY7563308.1 hypothetical protein [Salmonella enterica]
MNNANKNISVVSVDEYDPFLKPDNDKAFINKMEKINKEYLNPAFILEKKMKNESVFIDTFIGGLPSPKKAAKEISEIILKTNDSSKLFNSVFDLYFKKENKNEKSNNKFKQ